MSNELKFDSEFHVINELDNINELLYQYKDFIHEIEFEWRNIFEELGVDLRRDKIGEVICVVNNLKSDVKQEINRCEGKDVFSNE